jgi:hypothetical protein
VSGIPTRRYWPRKAVPPPWEAAIMDKKFTNSIQEAQEKIRKAKVEYEATNPGCSFEELINSEETQLDIEEFLDCSAKSQELSITELLVTLRADYDAQLASGEQRITNSIQACIHTLIERQQIDKLREEYADDESFLASSIKLPMRLPFLLVLSMSSIRPKNSMKRSLLNANEWGNAIFLAERRTIKAQRLTFHAPPAGL